jgi:nucleoside-diphosphate-sugar epimerase
MTGRLFVVGLGFSGLAIARRARARGWSVAGSVTTPEKVACLASLGIAAEPLDASSPALLSATHVLSTVPPAADGDPALRHCTAAVEAAPQRPAWIGYLSTTGIYGDRGGDWVDETAMPRPGPPRSRWRLAAEQGWQALGAAHGIPVHIFRLPAIYGPGRNALDQVRAGRVQRIDKPGQVFSRIHVEDLAQTIVASLDRPASVPGAIYNVADDDPAPQADVVALACELVGQPVPPLVPYEEAAPGMSDMARSFYAENRRVGNDRIKRELGVVLEHPSYREGLRAIFLSSPSSYEGEVSAKPTEGS